MTLVRHPYDQVAERGLFSLALELARDLPDQIDLGAQHFVCLVAWDARGATDVTEFADRLLRNGATYFICWGPGCERVHGLIDEVVTARGNAYGVPADSCIMTTSHESESLEDALHFFLVSSSPDSNYFESTRAGLAVSIGNAEWSAAIANALQNPGRLMRHASSRDAV